MRSREEGEFGITNPDLIQDRELHDAQSELFPVPPADIYPEQALALDILGSQIVEYKKEKYGAVVERVDLNKLLQIVKAAEPRFAAAEEYLQKMGELTEIPEDSIMSEKFNRFLEQAEEILRELKLLPDDFAEKKAAAPPISAEFLPDYPLQGHFISHNINHMFGYDAAEPKNIIRIGGKRLAPFATEARQRARKLGISLTQEQSLGVVLAHVVAHEYGHYLEELYEETKYNNQGFFTRAEQVSPNTLQLDTEPERQSVHGERFAQSIAQAVVKKILSGFGIESSHQRQLAMRLGGFDVKKIQGFKQRAEWGKQQGLSTYDVSGLLLKAKVALADVGERDLSEGIEYDWRKAGYYLPVYEEKKLRYIITGNAESTSAEVK